MYQPTQCTEMCLHYLGHPKYPPHGTAEVRNLVCQLPLGDHGHPNPQRRDAFIGFSAFKNHSMEVVAIYTNLGLGRGLSKAGRLEVGNGSGEEQNFGRLRPEISAKVLGSGQISLTLCKVPSNLTAWKQCKSHSCWSSRLGQVCVPHQESLVKESALIA